MSFFNKAKNKTQEAKGHLKETAGQATNNPDLEAEGTADRMAGDLKQAGEKVKDAFKK